MIQIGKDMKRRLVSKKKKQDIVRLTSSSVWSVPLGCMEIDLFLVGGGGAGNKWKTWNWSHGGAGAGGDTDTVLNIPVTPGQQITLSIGVGGQSAGADGASTTAIIDNKTYSALGGKGGKPSVYALSGIGLSVICGESGKHNGKYNNSGVAEYTVSGNMIGAVNANGVKIVEFDGTIYGSSTLFNPLNPYPYKTGVPEFWEEGGLLHAAGGSAGQSLKQFTDFTQGSGQDIRRSYNSGSDNGIQHGGGGYGGGGCGVTYGCSAFAIGGSGLVVIRYKSY